jgi:hypothetical protein
VLDKEGTVIDTYDNIVKNSTSTNELKGTIYLLLFISIYLSIYCYLSIFYSNYSNQSLYIYLITLYIDIIDSIDILSIKTRDCINLYKDCKVLLDLHHIVMIKDNKSVIDNKSDRIRDIYIYCQENIGKIIYLTISLSK